MEGFYGDVGMIQIMDGVARYCKFLAICSIIHPPGGVAHQVRFYSRGIPLPELYLTNC